jgi:ectoine hydroxylase-related dioxygenase (phytanoyl-CoA dioxygenase family)
LWEKPVLPTKWAENEPFFDPAPYMPVPDPDAEGMDIHEWDMQPGDAVAFNFGILHGARGNTSTARRRAFSLRLLGDDARHTPRPGATSPPFPGHDMVQGQRLRDDWFPTLYTRP